MCFMDIIPSIFSKCLTSENTFYNYLLIVDAYPKTPKLYGTERITTEEVMDNLNMIQDIFGKLDEFGWWNLEIISEDAGTQFTYTEFQDKCQTCGVWITLAAPEHQKMNGQAGVTWRKLRTISHSLMVHARVLEVYIHFELMYMTDHIFRFHQSKI